MFIWSYNFLGLNSPLNLVMLCCYVEWHILELITHSRDNDAFMLWAKTRRALNVFSITHSSMLCICNNDVLEKWETDKPPLLGRQTTRVFHFFAKLQRRVISKINCAIVSRRIIDWRRTINTRLPRKPVTTIHHKVLLLLKEHVLDSQQWSRQLEKSDYDRRNRWSQWLVSHQQQLSMHYHPSIHPSHNLWMSNKTLWDNSLSNEVLWHSWNSCISFLCQPARVVHMTFSNVAVLQKWPVFVITTDSSSNFSGNSQNNTLLTICDKGQSLVSLAALVLQGYRWIFASLQVRNTVKSTTHPDLHRTLVHLL